MTHTCHAPGCDKAVPPKMFACLPHWRMLPPRFQRAIWREYRSGQERDKQPSVRYLAVQRLACAVLASGAQVIDLAAQAAVFRERCIAAGVGDPLEGLMPRERSRT